MISSIMRPSNPALVIAVLFETSTMARSLIMPSCRSSVDLNNVANLASSAQSAKGPQGGKDKFTCPI
jgi:hypothetical protein